jgi:hypothetical protein
MTQRFAVIVAVTASLLLGGRAFALRIPEGEPARRALVYSFWNRDYLCLAARVPDTIITGTSNTPMSSPEQDDAIEFDLALPTPGGVTAYRLIISAAEGMTLLTQDARGNWRSDNAWIRGPRTLKYALNLTGTLNNPKDSDTEFMLECAIPWSCLGGMPTTDREIGFNVVNWMQGDNEGITSWSPRVTSPDEVGDPRRWGRMVITRGSPLMTAQGMAAVCPLNNIEAFIDGMLNAEEWLTASSLSFDKPDPQFQPDLTPAGQGRFDALLAIYRYDWDPAAFWQPNGEPATADQPKEGVGPWYSYTRVDWHRAQLDEIKRSGIDIILVRYRGDAESRRAWARTGLDRLTQALKEMRAEGKSYPLVGVMIDTAPLQGVDLKTDEGKQLLYGMVRDFYLHVPREFRAQLGAKPQDNLPGGVPVMLSDPTPLADWDGSFLSYVSERLGPIAWMGSPAWREKGAEGFHAYVHYSVAGLTQGGVGGAKAFVLTPGFCPAPGAPGEVRSRREGRAYRTDWQRVLAASPALVIVDWNDFASGTEIAPSRQYGFQYADATRVFKAQLGAGQAHSLRLLQSNVPDVLKPGASYLVEFVIENNGTEDVETGRQVSADYRITRRSDGRVVQQQPGAQDLRVMAGQIRRTPVSIAAVDKQDKPLPPGEYLFSLVVIKSSVPLLRSSFVAKQVAELTVPITVGASPARKATVISTSLPSSMEAGATENVVVRLRNDGGMTWKAGETKVTYRWRVHYDDSTQPEERVAEGFLGDDAGIPVPKDVAPGEVVSVVIPVMAYVGGPETPTLPMLHHYRVQWELVGRAGSSSEPDQPLADEAIQIVPRDLGVIIESVSAPAAMEAGGQADATVVVGNAGQWVWKAEETEVRCEWYSWDGKRPIPTLTMTHLPVDVKPGEKTTVVVPLAAPDAAGPYRLLWRVIAPEPGQRGRRRDLQMTSIMVRGGAYRPLDLSSLANVVAVTTDSYRARGGMDSSGRSFPAEVLPPDLSGETEGFYPSGYYATDDTGLGVPFSYPGAGAGWAGAVACDGQSIGLGPNPRLVYLLGASTEGDQEIEVTLKSADGAARPERLRVPSWLKGKGEAAVAVSTRYVRTLNGDDAETPAYLYELACEADGATALELPKNPAIKILAITVQDTGAPTGAK